MESQNLYIISFILVMSVATFVTRLLPFVFFSKMRDNRVINFIGHYLPLMVMPILVIYSLKDTQIQPIKTALPEMIAVVSVAVLHLRFSHALVSIGLGTGFYIALKHYL